MHIFIVVNMKADRLILLVLLAVVAIKFFTGFPLDSASFPGGTDVAHFFTNTWYIDTYGVTKWNYWWYGGFPFLKFYPPIAFLLTAFVGKIAEVGPLVAYKLVNNLFLTLDVLAFYFFVREFKLSKETEIISTTIFAFIPVFAYFFVDGRFTTLLNLFFALLYWKFLKRGLDRGGLVNASISISALFLSISFLTHHTTTLLFIVVSSAWALIYRPKFETVKKLFLICILTLAITAWWSFPFFLETYKTNLGSSGLYSRAVGNVNVADIAYRIRTSALESPYFVSSIEPYLLILLAASIVVAYLLSLARFRDKTVRDFIILSAFIVAMFFFIRYERSVIFLAVPVSIIAAEGFGLIKGRLHYLPAALFIILVATSYFLIRPQMNEVPNYPDIPKDGRVIFFPMGAAYVTSNRDMKNFYDVIFSPMNGHEDIRGWHDESQFVGVYAAEKYGYIQNVSDLMSYGKGDYYKLLSAGYVNYVVVNNNATAFLDYFNDSRFKEIYSDSMFTTFQLNPKSSYVEFNGNPAQSNMSKIADKIEINATCQKGTVVIKESYNDNWNISINGSPAATTYNEYGFTKLSSDVSGKCSIVMEFRNPEYYSAFYLISIITLLFVLFNILKNF